MIKIISLILLMTMMGSLGGLFFKKTSNHLGSKNIKLFLISLIVGASFYFIGAIMNIVALKFAPYTLVYPLTSITYIWTFLISKYYLKEKTTAYQLIGIALVICGTVVMVV
ncbi:DMT family transporter [Paenibacillus glucanolyticus]|uniref:DMT family transporter n=1 Tax=Paenibacillus glucanolyticus TaxID=59843 RepID=UPI0036835914